MADPDEPLDIGNGLICASFAAGGEWLSLATVDPDLGFVELTGMPPFDEASRGDPGAVRRYRSWMRQADHAFLRVDAAPATVTTRQEALAGTRRLTQQVFIEAPPSGRPADVRIRLQGRLARPAYAEITEVDPPRWQTAPTRLEVGDGALSVIGEGRPVLVQAWLRAVAGPSPGNRSDRGVSWHVLPGRLPAAEARVEWPEGAIEVGIEIACAFDAPVPPDPVPRTPWPHRRLRRPVQRTIGGPPPAPSGGPSGRADRPLVVPARLVAASERLTRRAVEYVRGCTALEVGNGQRCILADHRILPLSWTRDAYWQARLLLATGSRSADPGDVGIVADHLRWLFLRCERPDGRWVRSHYVDGRRKDRPFQADQQLYPILELTDFAQGTGGVPEVPTGLTWSDLLAKAWSAVEAAIDPGTGLIRADENPADDALSHPFVVSNQILLWRVAARLAVTAPRLGMPASPFAELATRTKAAVEEHLIVEGPLGRQWAYAVDARGGSELYHDANDLPVALAPLWGFCTPDDAIWRTTMRFALGPANPGWVPGRRGGLGSRHTPGTWTLGDIQSWIIAALRGDVDGAEAALERLIEIADLHDGMLPEAYDPEGASRAVRHWFAWPGAAFAVLHVEHAHTS